MYVSIRRHRERERACSSASGGCCLQVRFNFDATMIATAGMDGTARVWNAQNGALHSVCEGPSDSCDVCDRHYARERERERELMMLMMMMMMLGCSGSHGIPRATSYSAAAATACATCGSRSTASR